MHEAILLFVLAVLLAGVAARFTPRVGSDLRRPGFWIALASMAGAASAVSLLVSASRRAGTGMTTSYGWPKPFYFQYLSETGERADGFSLIYLAGNSLALASALVLAWTGWRFLRR